MTPINRVFFIAEKEGTTIIPTEGEFTDLTKTAKFRSILFNLNQNEWEEWKIRVRNG